LAQNEDSGGMNVERPAHTNNEESKDAEWFEDYHSEIQDSESGEYDISVTPNDFNVLTLFSFVESKAVRIPGFQRNFVWDLGRASKLIESLIIGLPVPQIFLYERAKNQFLVIDGQQRMMSIYYFMKKRFPRRDKRAELRVIFDDHGKIPAEILENDEYFQKFNLQLPATVGGNKNRFHGLNYDTLDEYKVSFELRPIRNIIVKQSSPSDDDSSMYEIFNRLNSGGVNLRPQEIRTSMYHSKFYDMLQKLNLNSSWRRLLGQEEPDLHMKDIEILLRGFAMFELSADYSPSMVKFLNRYSKKCEHNTDEKNNQLQRYFLNFLEITEALPEDIFMNDKNYRFNIALFEAVFVTCLERIDAGSDISGIEEESIKAVMSNSGFVTAATSASTSSGNVRLRLNIARESIKFN